MEIYRKKVEISDWLRIHMGEVFGDEPPDRFQGQKQEKRCNAGDCSLSAEQQMDLRTPGTCPLPRITALASALRQKPKQCCTHQRNELFASSTSKARIHNPEHTLQAHERRGPAQYPITKLPALSFAHTQTEGSGPCLMGGQES